MIRTLKIKNVALIKEAEINFGENLNVLSGETGAGKSVVMECVNFALGQKADKGMICRGENTCSVTCEFDISHNEKVKNLLKEMELDDETLVIRRTLSVEGKGGIRLNGEPVTAQTLRKITSLVVDVHGQSDHFLLLKENNQLSLLDKLGGAEIKTVKCGIKAIIDEIGQVKERLSSVGGTPEERAKNIDYIAYCIKDIEKVDFRKGEDEELAARKKRLLNKEKIATLLGSAIVDLTDDGGVTEKLASAIKAVSSLEELSDDFNGISERLSVCLNEITDAGETLNDAVDGDDDEFDLDAVESRIDEINLLKKKYGETYEDVIKTKEKLEIDYDNLVNSDALSEKLQKEIVALNAELLSECEKLTELRKKVFEGLQKKLIDKLCELGMPSAKFDVEFKDKNATPDGKDEVVFLFTANKGEDLKPLSKVISGGELSRLMLALKAVTVNDNDDGTFIFDEIDAGISGAAARVVAENFALISRNRQIIAISHLPQVVAMADTSFLIKKTENEWGTETIVKELNAEEKTKEVVRLIGGDETSASAVLHASDLVKKSDCFKANMR